MNETIIGGVRVRWICNACFEILLPSDRVILVDPYIDHCETAPFSAEELTGADFILLSHIHFDHMLDVGALWQRFGSRILVGDLSATELCRLQKVPAGSIYRVRSGEAYQFDDVKIEVIAARHTEWRQGVFFDGVKEQNTHSKRPEEETQALWLGFLEMVNYRITASDGTCIVVWGGMPTEDQVHRFSGGSADIAMMHVSPNGDQEMFLRLAKAINARIIVPHHYDLSERLIEQNPDLIPPDAMRPRQLLEHLRAAVNWDGCRFVEFTRGRWYRVGTALVADGKVDNA